MKKVWILPGLLFLLMLSRTLNGVWGGDFWEHSAVVRELATHPISPVHPRLALNAPHVFFSPYHLGAALFSRVFSLDTITALSFVGLVNLLLLLLSLRLFVGLVLGNGRAFFYTIIFMLFLWGSRLLYFSGFFHFNVLGYVLPYPSTFCAAAAFFMLSGSILYFKDGRKKWLAANLVCSVIILLSHTITAVFAYTGMVAVAVAYYGVFRPMRRGELLLYFSIIPLSLIVASLWPYYPFLHIILKETKWYHWDNQYVYQKLFLRTFPALIAVPLIVQRFRRNRRDLLVWMFIGLSAFFIYGWLSQKYSYGRMLSFLMITLQMAAADWMARREQPFKRPIAAVMCVGLPLLIYANYGEAFRQCLPGYPGTHKQYVFLSQYTGQYDTILTDIHTGWVAPTFGGKVVTSLRSLAFVPDDEQRREDVKRFFEEDTTADERVAMSKHYGADFVLINKETCLLSERSQRAIEDVGAVVYRNEQFTLIRSRF